VGFVNGLPLVVIELKKPGVPARAAFDENPTSYKHPQNGIPTLFVFNAPQERRMTPFDSRTDCASEFTPRISHFPGRWR